MVAFARLDHLREALAGAFAAPVEFAAVDDDAADCGAVAADPFRGRVDDDVGAVLQGLHVVAACAEGVVYYDGDGVLVGDCGDGFEVGDVVAWVADGFDVDGFGLVVDQLLKVFGLVALHEFGVDAEAGEEDFELVVGASVEVGGGDDVVAGVCEGGDGHELGGLT